MEPAAFYISLSEGVYGSWRAVGGLEDLQSDGEIAQFLVALYSRQKQGDGEESSLRCVVCHCPLTLYCSTSQCPSPLTLPTQRPPPSLSSPPPPPPTQVLDTSAPASVPSHTDRTPHLTQHTLVTDVKDEEDSAGSPQEDGGESDFDDCPVDFGSAKQHSPSSACDSEPTTAKTDFTASSTQCLSLGRGKRRKDGSGKHAETSDLGKRKKRTTTMYSTRASKSKKRKVVKKNHRKTDNLETDSCVEGVQKTREDNLVRAEDLVRVATQELVSLAGKVRNIANRTLENLTEEEKKGTLCEPETLDEGFAIPVEERCSALIHRFDDSFFKRHKIEDKPPRYTRQKASAKNHKLVQKEASEPHSQVEDGGSIPRTDSNAESVDLDETSRHSLRILVSGQKIPPLKTADGSYTRTLYSHFECLFCKKAFIHKRTFNRHIQTHAEENLYKCTLCDKGFESLYNLREHEKKHKFECEICGKKCTEKNDYNDHMKLHRENNGVMKCPGCAYQSTDFYIYRKHKYECAYLRPALQCEICGVHLKSVKSLKHHIAAIHRNDRPYKCTLCEKSFVFKTKLTCHMKYNHAEGGRLFHCDKCGNRFIDPKGLKSHQKSVHSNEKPFKCTYCPSAFARKYTLGVHLRLHTGEKPFRCTECLQAFVQKPSLLLHLRSHHGQKATKVIKQVEAENCS